MKKLLALAAVTAAMAVSQALADFIPLPVKWSQPIGYEPGTGVIIGKDRLSDHTVNVVRADDFICNDPLPIVAVRWWGSYIGKTQRPDGYTGPFDISFHLSTHPQESHPISRPDALLLLQTVTAQEVYVGQDQNGDAVYRYDAYLASEFPQQPGLEYFLDICKPTGEDWGWHESPYGGLDYPAVAPAHPGPWANDPPHDLAFELMVVPEPGTIAAGALLLIPFGVSTLRVWHRKRAA